MPVDYIVASLPALAFDAPAPISREKFRETADAAGVGDAVPTAWADLETQLRNAVAEARGGAAFRRPATGCALYWRNRVLACFQEKDVLKRDELLDRVWWDAAGELTPPSDPLGKGALATYAVRLEIALKRAKISREGGNRAFDQLTQVSRLESRDLEARA